MKWKIILPLLIALPAVIIAFNGESDGKAQVISFYILFSLFIFLGGCIFIFALSRAPNRVKINQCHFETF